MKHSSCLVTNFASAPIFEIAADDFALCLRARMHLPCRIVPFYEVPASKSLRGKTPAASEYWMCRGVHGSPVGGK